MNKNLNSKLKYTSLRDAHLHLIKLITHKDINKNIINKKLTHNEIMELINEYYFINNLQPPKISIQSISNLKNRKLKIKSVECNKYTEDFALFIKNKFDEFNIELFFSITHDNIENKEKILIQKNVAKIKIDDGENIIKNNEISNNQNTESQNQEQNYKLNINNNVCHSDYINNSDKINDKVNYIYNYWLIIGIIGLLLIYYNEELSKEYLNFNNIKDIEPTTIEEFPDDHVDLSKESTSKTWISGEAADKINLKFITSIIISFTLGACASTFVLYCIYTKKDVIITPDTWTLTPNSLDKRQGLLIEKAIIRNSILENLN